MFDKVIFNAIFSSVKVMDQLHEKENECKDTKSNLENEQRQFAVLRHQMGLMYEDYTKERQTWKDLEKDLKTALAASNENLDGMWINFNSKL